MEKTRISFADLVTSVPEAGWNSKPANSAWTRKEELWHIAWGTRFIIRLIKNARFGVGFPVLPAVLFDTFNVLYTRVRACGASRESIVNKYNDALDEAIAKLNTCTDTQLEKTVRVLGENQSVASLFQGIVHHLEEHRARIQPDF